MMSLPIVKVNENRKQSTVTETLNFLEFDTAKDLNAVATKTTQQEFGAEVIQVDTLLLLCFLFG